MNHPFSPESPAGGMLAALFEQTAGRPGASAGMWDIGQGLGLDRAHTEDAAMELVSEGLVEIKSLSGGLVLTEAALALLKTSSADEPHPVEMEWLLTEIEQAAGGLGLDERVRTDLEIDLAALRLQAGRNRPLDGVRHGLLEAVRAALAASKASRATELAGMIAGLKKD